MSRRILRNKVCMASMFRDQSERYIQRKVDVYIQSRCGLCCQRNMHHFKKYFNKIENDAGELRIE
jgi:hypothetical protein